MPRTKSSNQAQYKYNSAHIKRVPLDLQLTDYEALRKAASIAGESVNGYIKRAISERMDREGTHGGFGSPGGGRGTPESKSE